VRTSERNGGRQSEGGGAGKEGRNCAPERERERERERGRKGGREIWKERECVREMEGESMRAR